MKSHNPGRFRGAAFRMAALLVLAVTADAARADIRVQQARIEPVDGESGAAAAYFELRNDTGHELQLLKVESPRAELVELKQRSLDASNRPHLWPVARLQIPPGATARFRPDGRFFRLLGVTGPLRAGERVPLVLHFEHEPALTVELVVAAR